MIHKCQNFLFCPELLKVLIGLGNLHAGSCSEKEELRVSMGIGGVVLLENLFEFVFN